jgi:hypothetical protein
MWLRDPYDDVWRGPPMHGFRRGVAVVAASMLGAAPATAGTGTRNISVRRRADLAPVAVLANVRADDGSSALAGHMEVSRA